MALREQQIGGPRLPKPLAFLIHIVSSVCVFLLSYFFWLHVIIDVPEEFRLGLASTSTILFFLLRFGIIKEGYAGALRWMGKYTDDSYSSGIYCLPTLPFPVLLLLLKVLAPELYDKFLWTMGEVVPVQDITVPVTTQFLSSDGVRMLANSTLLFQMENVARFLIQTTNNTDRDPLLEAIVSVYAGSIKNSSLNTYSAQEIFRGEYQKDQTMLISTIMQQFDLIKNYGLSLAASPMVKVMFESKKVENTFDQVAASTMLDTSAEKLAERFASIKKKNPSMDDAIIYAMLRGSSGEEGGPELNIVRVR